MSADTIVPDPTNPQSFNRYSYVYNNPVRYTDSTGHYIDQGHGGSGLPPCPDTAAGPSCGAMYLGAMGIASGGANSPEMQALITNVGELVVGIIWEPADWAIALSDGVQWYDGLGMLPLVPAAFGDNIGRAAMRMIPAGMADEAVDGTKLIGRWVSESNNADWKKYEEYITGIEGMAFKVHDVKFDGVIGDLNHAGNIDNLILLDAKHWSNDFVNGMVYGNHSAYSSKIQQARDQIQAANGISIQWHFHDEAAANLWRSALEQEGIFGIDVIFTPWTK